MFQQLRQLPKIWADWGGSPGLFDDSQWRKDVTVCHRQLTTAQLALRITKGVHALYDLEGQELKDEIEKCLKKKDTLPPFLAQALEKAK